jgi:hypothetical protein
MTGYGIGAKQDLEKERQVPARDAQGASAENGWVLMDAKKEKLNGS